MSPRLSHHPPPWVTIAVGVALLALAVALRLLVGPDGVGDWPRDGAEFELRLLRVASGATVGAALAVSGVLLQSLLRNPLASPAVLGLTSGASLGVMISIYLGFLATGAVVQYEPPALSALLGAMATLGVVYAIAQRRGMIDPVTLILVGVIVSLIAGALTMLVMHLLPAGGLAASVQWTLGSLNDDVRWSRLTLVGVVSLIGIGAGAFLGPAMDAAALSDDEARAVGVRLTALRITLFLLAGTLTSGSVLLAGPIAFVGLVIPHLVRALGGPSHRTLVVSSAMGGAALIVLADTLVRVIDLGSGRMPIGVLTALVGGPVFLVILLRRPPGGES